MTKKQQIYETARAELNYSEIAKAVGCSRQYVAITLQGTRRETSYKIKPNQIAYPALRKYMNVNKMSISKLYRMMTTQRHVRTLILALRNEAPLLKTEIDQILKITGMTYEECFREEQND